MAEFSHTPVLLDECLEGLAIRPDGIYVDGTAGGAGHSREIAKRLTTGRLIALDKDPTAVEVARERLAGLPAQVVESDYADLTGVLDRLGIPEVNGILLDLGVSSYQLDTPERGFSYMADAPLDMRMTQKGPSAYDLVNTSDVSSLARIIREFGEERYALPIAKKICRAREKKPVETTGELAELIREAIPPSSRYEGGHPAKRTFQAIRIAVNSELDNLSRCLDTAFGRLAPGGRFAVITFHSLEDRMVKQKFAAYCRGCICPPDFPVCVCGHTPEGRLVNRKPIEPGQEEQERNSRSKSAKLRIIEKL
jgi:16S rRNA (cytosine1402-N4)-methyltransferase